MLDLKDDLGTLHDLNDARNEAKKWRKKGMRSLSRIKSISSTGVAADRNRTKSREEADYLDHWTCANNLTEIAWLVQVVSNENMRESDAENEQAELGEFRKKLRDIKIKTDLFPNRDEAQDPDNTVPVLVAARVLRALTADPETVFSKASMLCYYRIIRELYFAAQPDWTIGAGRAGEGGRMSAFITSECIRSIFAFENTIRRTSRYFECTLDLYNRHSQLNKMLGFASAGPERSLRKWADKAIQRMWLDWLISTDPHTGGIALHYSGKDRPKYDILPLPPTTRWAPGDTPKDLTMVVVGEAFEKLKDELVFAVRTAENNIAEVFTDIAELREKEREDWTAKVGEREQKEIADEVRRYLPGLNIDSEKLTELIGGEMKQVGPLLQNCKAVARGEKRSEGKFNREEILRKVGRTNYKKLLKETRALIREIPEVSWHDPAEGAHRMALKVIQNAYRNAKRSRRKCEIDAKKDTLRDLLESLCAEYKRFPGEMHRVLEPAKRFVRTVLDRELAAAHSGSKLFDAGELVFAATAFGAATHWKRNEQLAQACKVLVESLAESGRFITNRPFHATVRGYKLLPIGCEMTRHFAKLLHRTGYEFEPQIAKRMLNIFTDKQLVEHDGGDCAGWNFENAPHADHPYVWVTAISVRALDRIVRMLNHRINELVFRHFKVVKPEKPNTNLTLNDLIYPDYGLMTDLYGDENYQSPDKEKKSIAIRLEQMRAHVMRTSLPSEYKKDIYGNEQNIFSAILYGPPGTGKTTLVEALAASSKVPLVMLSPSDLIVQGQEQLEARAKAVFDALSMLSQTIILFDEFEPVLRTRTRNRKKNRGFTGLPNELSKVEKAIREGGGSMLSFLLTGMLPKLVSLHQAAGKQALVYCLATNHLEEIDEAAKRGGRFDVHQPIYNPDPISRAGTFLFRLQPVSESPNEKGVLRERVSKIVAATANRTAGDLSRRFFKQPDKNKEGEYDFTPEDKIYSYFAYALGQEENFQPDLTKLRKENLRDMKREFRKASKSRVLDKDEKEQRLWFLNEEKKWQRKSREVLELD